MSSLRLPAGLVEPASLDLLFFNGPEVVSRAIRLVQRPGWNRLPRHVRQRSRRHGYSHVGLVVRADVLDAVPPGETWVLESTMSGRWRDGAPAVDGAAHFGVHLRRYRDLLAAYTGPLAGRGAAVGYAAWRGEVPPGARAVLSALWRERLRGTGYDWNPIVLAASICPQLRPVRAVHARFVPQDRALFCSELVATVLRWLGIVGPDVAPDDVVPMDFVGWGAEGLDWLVGGAYGPIRQLTP